MPPAVSIVMTLYNRADFVAAAIGSILRQTFRDFELIVCDDGSTDASVEGARHAAGDDPRVSVISNAHAGAAKAFNTAVQRATGEFLGWVDSDDGLMPKALEETVAHLRAHPACDMVYTDYLTMNESGQVLGPGTRTRTPYSKDRLLIEFMTFHFRLLRRGVLQRVGGMDESFSAAIDYDLCLRLSEIAQIEHLPRPLYLYRVHQNSISSARRLEQIMASKRAIERALERRAMAGEFEVEVEIVGRYRLRRKAPPAVP